MSEPTEYTGASEHTGTVAELRDELRERLPTSGTKDELMQRLDADDAAAKADEDGEETEEEAAAAEAIAEADLVSDEGEINTDSVANFAEETRAAIAEFSDQLDLLAGVLTDLEARSTDPAAGALVAASGKVRAHCDDVARHLSPLSAGIQALATEATAAQPE